MAPEHADLSDDELVARLEQKGYCHSAAVDLVAHRDNPEVAEFIAEHLEAVA